MMTTRRQAFKKVFDIGKNIGFGGLLWGLASQEAAKADIPLRPPGAPNKDKRFVQSCTKCGKCVEACPYDSLKLASIGDGKVVGTPYFEPRAVPCYMCEPIHCAEHCPSGALDLKRLADQSGTPTINNARMGLAVLHKESCLAHWGIQCDVCYRECPLLDKAIKLKREINQDTRKHANVVPVVDSNYCTGCGICERVCVVKKAAIFVLPRSLAMGAVNDHYVKSWEKSDEKRIKKNREDSKSEDRTQNQLDYLNEDDLY